MSEYMAKRCEEVWERAGCSTSECCQVASCSRGEEVTFDEVSEQVFFVDQIRLYCEIGTKSTIKYNRPRRHQRAMVLELFPCYQTFGYPPLNNFSALIVILSLGTAEYKMNLFARQRYSYSDSNPLLPGCNIL